VTFRASVRKQKRRSFTKRVKIHKCTFTDCGESTYLKPWCTRCAKTRHGVMYMHSQHVSGEGGLVATRDFNVSE
jgi:hypothetical protein